jgi:hypothetical protein
MTVNSSPLDWRYAIRNVVLSLIAVSAPTEELAADCMIHIWYSSLITEAHAKILEAVGREFEII